TQDTVWAMEAIAQLRKVNLIRLKRSHQMSSANMFLSGADMLNIDKSLKIMLDSAGDRSWKLMINKSNEHTRVQQLVIDQSDLDASLDIYATGAGLALLQLDAQYEFAPENMLSILDQSRFAFQLEANYELFGKN